MPIITTTLSNSERDCVKQHAKRMLSIFNSIDTLTSELLTIYDTLNAIQTEIGDRECYDYEADVLEDLIEIAKEKGYVSYTDTQVELEEIIDSFDETSE